MSQSKPLKAGLVALATAFGLPGMVGAGEAADAPFRIMNAGEIATHTAAMKALEGSAREDYRNSQYAQLRERAAQYGYRMPEMPPWQTAPGTALTPAEPASTATTTEDDAAARHAELRAQMAASRAAVEQAGAAPEPAAGSEPTAETQAAPEEPAVAVAPSALPAALGTRDADLTAPTPPAAEAASPTMAAASDDAPAQVSRAPVTPLPPPPPVAPEAPSRVTAGGPQPPARPAEMPRFVPPEVAAEAQAVNGEVETAEPTVAEQPAMAPPPLPAPPMPPVTPVAPGSEQSPAEVGSVQDSDSAVATGEQAPMDDYRAKMRARFDSYMQERQAQVEETARRQREQHEANMARNRATRPAYGPYPGMGPGAGYPAGPGYGPRYPGAFPGYGAPYWQQP